MRKRRHIFRRDDREWACWKVDCLWRYRNKIFRASSLRHNAYMSRLSVAFQQKLIIRADIIDHATLFTPLSRASLSFFDVDISLISRLRAYFSIYQRRSLAAERGIIPLFSVLTSLQRLPSWYLRLFLDRNSFDIRLMSRCLTLIITFHRLWFPTQCLYVTDITFRVTCYF